MYAVSLSHFHCCGHHGIPCGRHGWWPSWYRPNSNIIKVPIGRWSSFSALAWLANRKGVWLVKCPAQIVTKSLLLGSSLTWSDSGENWQIVLTGDTFPFSSFSTWMFFLQYFDAVAWVCWPVKPTTESENRLQLDSLSTSVDIDRLTMVDNTSAVGNDSRPWVVPPVNKWLSTITRERRIPPDSEFGGIPHLFGTSLFPHIGSCLTGSSWQQQQLFLECFHAVSLLVGLRKGIWP